MHLFYFIIIAAVAGLALGYVAAWLIGRSRIASLETELRITRESAELTG
jgi:NhaP-type Na+/H+ or K+/H+ antiporter